MVMGVSRNNVRGSVSNFHLLIGFTEGGKVFCKPAVIASSGRLGIVLGRLLL